MSQLRTNSIVPVGGIPAGASGGGIIQVVSTTKTDTYTVSLASGAIDTSDITGLTASITPRSTSNKILVRAVISCSATDNATFITLYRGGSAIDGARGATAGSRQRVSASTWSSNNAQTDNAVIQYLDSPSSTSSLTYSLRLSHSSGITRTVNVNFPTSDGDNSSYGRTISTITLYEVSG
jgi:hypothetical protein